MPSIYAEIDTMGSMEIAVYTSSMLRLWTEQDLPGMDCARAFALIKYGNIKDTANYKTLMSAMLRLHMQQKYSKATPYHTLSEYKRTYALTALSSALDQYSTEDWFSLIPKTDRLYETIAARQRREIGRRRDPEGSIDLEAFANDSQSVHRASVQTAMNETLTRLVSEPLPNGMNAFNEIMDAYSSLPLFREKNQVLYVFACDLDTLSVSLQDQAYKYRDVVDHVWARIRSHEHKHQLIMRLMEELEDGYIYCANGKVARLVNVLVGFEEGFLSIMDNRELLQERIVSLIPLPVNERIQQAQILFRDLMIAEEDQGAWMEALTDA